METPTKGDNDDLVDTDTDQETNNEESEDIYWIEESNFFLDQSETDERHQRKHQELLKMIKSQKIGDYDLTMDILKLWHPLLIITIQICQLPF